MGWTEEEYDNKNSKFFKDVCRTILEARALKEKRML